VPYPDPAPCYHEAGHAVVAFHRGLKLLYVTMQPPAGSGHYGHTATVAPEVMDLGQLEIAMQVAAAGDIAWSWFLPTRDADREERTDDWLMKRFRNAARAVVESDPWFHDIDRLIFAERGLERDAKIRDTGAEAVIDLEAWVRVFREAERLVCDELWPAVEAVAQGLIQNPARLSHEDVAKLVATATANTEQGWAERRG
jgi:hypothetical protein